MWTPETHTLHSRAQKERAVEILKIGAHLSIRYGVALMDPWIRSLMQRHVMYL
jgi:hypothetical protein